MKNIKSFLVARVIAIGNYFYKNFKYKTNNNYVKVNLGCGLQCLPNWINIDGSLTALFGSKSFSFFNKMLYKLAGSSDYYTFNAYNKVVQKNVLKFYNLQKGVPLLDTSVDVIYCSHFLEHLSKDDGKYFMRECFCSLKNGGLLRMVVPDLDFAMEMYQRGDVEKMLDLFYYTSSEWDFAAHKYNYNFTYLKNILENIGFTNIKKMNYKEGDCPDIDYLDVYPEHSLYVECKK
jgi:hypothetical protein